MMSFQHHPQEMRPLKSLGGVNLECSNKNLLIADCLSAQDEFPRIVFSE